MLAHLAAGVGVTAIAGSRYVSASTFKKHVAEVDTTVAHPGARVSTGEHVKHLETLNVRKDGTVFRISLNVSPIRDAVGAIAGASVICRDLSRRGSALCVVGGSSPAGPLISPRVRGVRARR